LTSKERVLCTFDFKQPDRVPAWYGMSDEFREKAKRELGLDDEELLVRFGDDFRRVFPRYTGPDVALSGDAASRTIFGVERRGLGYGQPMSHPLENATLDDVHAYPWPDPAWSDTSGIKAEAEAFGREYAVLGGDWSPFWHDAIDLLGMENLYFKMHDEPELVDALLAHMVDYYAAVSLRIFEAAGSAIDIFFMGNDFGSQTGPLMGPDLFRRFILPHLVRLSDLGHDFGLKVLLHCCGGFAPLIPLMIEARIDGVHTIQPSCAGMELEKLKADHGRAIVFNGAIDSHHVLISGTPESVRENTRQVLDIMKPGGGYVAGASHDTILEETSVENVLAMSDAIRDFGVYGKV